MNTKDFSKMAILDQSVLQKAEKGRFVVDKDYNLNGAKLVVPKGMTIDLSSGSINNGTLVLDDVLLENMSAGCIDARIEGTVRNSTIYTSDIGGIDNLGVNLSGKTIYCNIENDVVNNTIILNDINTSLTTIFDGMYKPITCNEDLFHIHGQSNIIIKNFIANANSNILDLEFENMVTTEADVTGIQIYSNIVNGFSVGISLNNDSSTYTVSYCTVHDNYIKNCLGSTSGHGYGIHLANARHCTVSHNEIRNCERHAIYHAYGEYNTISYNTIKNHCKNLTTYNYLAALEIGRKSKNVTVSYNTFENNNNICLLVYSPLPSNDGTQGLGRPWRYGKCEQIYIQNNTFDRGSLTGTIGNLPFIFIGWEGAFYPSLSNVGKVVVDVHISNNTFKKNGGENHKCILIYQCEQLTIIGNTFELGLPSPPQSSEYLVFQIPHQYISANSSQIIVTQNIFNYLSTGLGNLYLLGEDLSLINTSNSPYYHLVWYNNTLQNQIIGGNTMYKIYNPSYPPGNNCSIV